MSYAPNYHSDSKIPAFVTKVPHDVVLTQTDTRLFIKNIKTGVTMDQFKNAMKKFGPVQVYLYEPGNQDNGWAWVGFENKETALKAVENYEYREVESKENKEESTNPTNEETVHNAKETEVKAEEAELEVENEKHESNSLYAENEENNDSDEENDNEQDKNDENDEDDA